jgi:Outer membrane protein beta-barrel domain
VSKWIGISVLLLAPIVAMGQSPPSAVGGEAGVWAGGEFSLFNPDWSCSSSVPFGCGSKELYGIAPFVDLNIHDKLGVEGEARWLHWNGPVGEVESNYLAGPRYLLFQHGKLYGWAKLMFGGGWITSPDYPAAGSLKGSYFAYAPGASLDYRLRKRFSVRADYEYEVWPSFVGTPGYVNGQLVTHEHPLSPNGVSFGVSYRIFGK